MRCSNWLTSSPPKPQSRQGQGGRCQVPDTLQLPGWAVARRNRGPLAAPHICVRDRYLATAQYPMARLSATRVRGYIHDGVAIYLPQILAAGAISPSSSLFACCCRCCCLVSPAIQPRFSRSSAEQNRVVRDCLLFFSYARTPSVACYFRLFARSLLPACPASRRSRSTPPNARCCYTTDYGGCFNICPIPSHPILHLSHICLRHDGKQTALPPSVPGSQPRSPRRPSNLRYCALSNLSPAPISCPPISDPRTDLGRRA
ncbi:hypothetical protein B0T16DRAFT_107062 [Cercophora newfieldiana]|uniref:Uncharacterized protein n=1 Tax=Cercophora newfieldiana TaxID=92897 RepID=A0AA39YJX8_9PEZI|nr:hypothetical protein B0T16DRAFT_107062 [Cercophora newfieldiana]